MARAAIELGVRELAQAAQVSTNTITRFERGEELKARTVAAIRAALQTAGVIFVDENGDGPGVRLRKAHKTPADVTRAMAEKTEAFLNREEVVAETNMREIQEEAEKRAGGQPAIGAERREASRALAERKLDKRLADVDAPPEEKERRKAALTKPPRRGPK